MNWWNFNTFSDLLKKDTLRAYQYRKETLWHPIPEEVLQQHWLLEKKEVELAEIKEEVIENNDEVAVNEVDSQEKTESLLKDEEIKTVTDEEAWEKWLIPVTKEDIEKMNFNEMKEMAKLYWIFKFGINKDNLRKRLFELFDKNNS